MQLNAYKNLWNKEHQLIKINKMSKKKTATAGFKFVIQMKGKEALTVYDADLKQACWDSIYELERQNQQSFKYLSESEMLDSLLQNYYTWKMIHREFQSDIIEEMKAIEEFITKHQRRILTAMHLEELSNSLPAMHLEN